MPYLLKGVGGSENKLPCIFIILSWCAPATTQYPKTESFKKCLSTRATYSVFCSSLFITSTVHIFLFEEKLQNGNQCGIKMTFDQCNHIPIVTVSATGEKFSPKRNAWEPVASMHSRRSTHEVNWCELMGKFLKMTIFNIDGGELRLTCVTVIRWRRSRVCCMQWGAMMDLRAWILSRCFHL